MIRSLCSPNYKYTFDTKTGFFRRWGKTVKDDPDWSLFGPEILDLEISTVCTKGCKFCYKDNTKDGKNMSFETFKTILHKMPKNLLQVAFGVGDLKANPDLISIISYCRYNDYNKIVPNITINDSTEDSRLLSFLALFCGSVAVSYYGLTSLDIAEKLIQSGCDQTNIHYVLSEESKEEVETLFRLISKNEVLREGLNAIVFLCLKPKGRGREQRPCTDPKDYKKLYELSKKYEITIGFDSCSANNLLKGLEGSDEYEELAVCVEPCESGLFSSYINVDGKFVVCSFAEGEEGHKEGIDVVNCSNFMKDVWFSDYLVQWRKKLLANNRSCPIFNLGE